MPETIECVVVHSEVIFIPHFPFFRFFFRFIMRKRRSKWSVRSVLSNLTWLTFLIKGPSKYPYFNDNKLVNVFCRWHALMDAYSLYIEIVLRRHLEVGRKRNWRQVVLNYFLYGLIIVLHLPCKQLQWIYCNRAPYSWKRH